MKTPIKKILMAVMTMGLFVGLISFSVCHRPHGIDIHETKGLQIRQGVRDEQPSPLSKMTPSRAERSTWVAYDGGGTYGG